MPPCLGIEVTSSISPGKVLAHEPFSWNALRLKAVSTNLFSSVRWVDLVPVAGAAAGSRPTYLKWSTDSVARGWRAGLRRKLKPYQIGFLLARTVRKRGRT